MVKRRSSLRYISALALILLSTAFARAHTPLTLSSSAGANAGVVQRWDFTSLPNQAIPYFVNPTRPAGAAVIAPGGVSESDLVSVARSAFQAWQSVPGARVRFDYQGTTTQTNGADGINVVTFSPQGFNFPAGFPGGIFPLITAAIAPGPVKLANGSSINATFAGQIVDCDLVVNPQGTFTIAETLPQQNEFDLLGILVHESGHMLGLDHSGVLNSVMYGFYTLSGGYFNRAPKEDDIASLSVLYPTPQFLARSGMIKGAVTSSSGAPIFGAQVVAVDSDTGMVAGTAMTGVTQTSAEGLASKFQSSSGNYVLAGLPPGSYSILAEPLDGPTIPYMSGAFGTGSGGQSFLTTNFLPSDPTAPMAVAAAGSLTQNFGVNAKSATAPNIGAAPFSAPPGGVFIAPPLITQGTAQTLAVGSNDNLFSGSTVIAGSKYSVSGPGVTVGTPAVASGFLYLPISVAGNASTGPRLLSVNVNNTSSVVSGGITVMPPPLTFAQFANGEGSSSTTVLVNPSSTVTASARVELRDDNGQTLQAGFKPLGKPISPTSTESIRRTSLDVVIAPLGSATINSDGLSGFTSGSAIVTANHPLGGSIKFNIGGLGVAGVGESKSMSPFLTPVRRTQTINTGVAIRNLSGRDLTVSLTLRNNQGISVNNGATTRLLKADGHLAAFITELFPLANLTDFSGTLLVAGNAGGLMAATALELGANPGEFTTLPVTAPQDSAGLRTYTFAHFANGVGVRSDLVITNASSAPLNGTAEFFDDSGKPLAFGLAGLGTRSSVNVTIPALGSTTISSDSLGGVIAGSVRLTTDRNAGGVVRFGIQGLGIAGVGVSEALDAGFIVPVHKQSSGIDTGVAFVNAGDVAADLQIILRDSLGVTVKSMQLTGFPVRGHLAKFTRELFSDLTSDDFDGTLAIVIQTPGGKIAGTALELGGAAGQFTTLPVVQLR